MYIYLKIEIKLIHVCEEAKFWFWFLFLDVFESDLMGNLLKLFVRTNKPPAGRERSVQQVETETFRTLLLRFNEPLNMDGMEIC